MKYWKLDQDALARKYIFTGTKHYPRRLALKEWPDMKLIGKAIAKGWSTPCRYYRFRRGGCCIPTVFAGISDAEYLAIQKIMKLGDKKC